MFFKLKIDYLKFSERLCIANDTMGLTRVTFFCPKKIEQDLNKPHPNYSKLSPSCQLSSSGGWLLPGFSQTVKMLWRACDQPSNKVLSNCQEASQRQQLLLSRHLSPSSITLIKCSSSHSVIDKARQWLDQGPIKKKRSWPCTTWRYRGCHCASKNCNWERPSRPPLRKRGNFSFGTVSPVFVRKRVTFFNHVPWSFLGPQFWFSIFLQSNIFQKIEYNPIKNFFSTH